MSLHSPVFYLIPEQTAQIARAAFPKGNPYIRMRDALGPIYTNPEFTTLFSKTGQPAEAPAQLALVSVMQFAEHLSDEQAATAVRARIDWKYALALELTDPGFDASVLCDFRARLIEGQAELLLFETMLTLFREQGLIKVKGRQRTDSTHVLAAIQTLNRLECVGETVRQALNQLAAVAPEWLRAWVPTEWFDRYSRRFAEYRLPTSKAARYTLAEQIGTDGQRLLRAVAEDSAPAMLRELEALLILQRVWEQQFSVGADQNGVRWRTAEELPAAAALICSPYDPDARYSKKRATEWTGYKVHLSETCDDDTPHLITDVTTTPATTADTAVLSHIQEQLARREVTPAEQLVDSGYISAELLRSSRSEQEIELIGPVRGNYSWQATAENGVTAAQFVLDWEDKRAHCPQGQTSVVWHERTEKRGQAVVDIRFSRSVCAGCQQRTNCTTSTKAGRSLTVQAQEQYLALQVARERQATPAFKGIYAQRAGIEGTLSQGVRLGDLRRSRYLGCAKTRLMHLILAAALNFMRVAAWLAETPRSRTRQSAFARLAAAPG